MGDIKSKPTWDDEKSKHKPKKQRERKNYSKYRNKYEDEGYLEWKNNKRGK